MPEPQPPLDALGAVALACAALAAVLLVHHLVRRPALTLAVKLRLAVALAVLPGIAAVASTATGMHATTQREFCGSCHVMAAHYDDATTPASQTLAARHTRNPFFGRASCYTCHADYGMYGYAMTKVGGMRHVYEYYFGGYRDLTLAEARSTIRLRKPYDNANCRQCHTTSTEVWGRVPDHEALRAELEANRVSCASAGCHGFAHPFTKDAPAAAPRAGTTSSASAGPPTPGTAVLPASAASGGSVPGTERPAPSDAGRPGGGP